jgi:hypothetical protein
MSDVVAETVEVQVAPPTPELDVKTDVVRTDELATPVKVAEEDFDKLREIQVTADALGKYRAELGRLYQAINNLCAQTNAVEENLSEQRRALVAKYGLEAAGDGQWAVDFEKREFTRVSPSAPVIP